MITTYLRSSSWGNLICCEHKYFLGYVLGFRYPSGKSAEKGSISHGQLEALAQQKLAIQEGRDHFIDDRLGRIDIPFDENDIFERFYEHYKADSIHHWTKADYRDCQKWYEMAKTYMGGHYNPMQQWVISPEKKFDFILEGPEFSYEFTHPNGEILKGQLGIHGTIDLVVGLGPKENPSEILELVDYKTGARLDWNRNRAVKDYKKLLSDEQLCLYYYAVSLLYPEAKHIIASIFFIKAGGVFSLPYDQSTIKQTRKMLADTFARIKAIQTPKLNIRSHCDFCEFKKNGFEGKSVCNFFKDTVQEIGLSDTMKKYGKIKSFNSYGDGAGRKADV